MRICAIRLNKLAQVFEANESLFNVLFTAFARLRLR